MIKKIAVIAAHPDDEALGCGGTLLKLRDQGLNINLMFLTDGIGARQHATSAQNNTRHHDFKRAMAFLNPHTIVSRSFPDNKLDTIPLLDIVKEIEGFLIQYSPDLVLTHYEHDLNIDHCLTYRATVTACRPGSNSFVNNLYSFEVPSSTEWTASKQSFIPDTFVEISDYIDMKLEYIRFYGVEIRDYPHPRSIQNIRALNQLRGAIIARPFAEGFSTIRSVDFKW